MRCVSCVMEYECEVCVMEYGCEVCVMEDGVRCELLDDGYSEEEDGLNLEVFQLHCLDVLAGYLFTPSCPESCDMFPPSKSSE